MNHSHRTAAARTLAAAVLTALACAGCVAGGGPTASAGSTVALAPAAAPIASFPQAAGPVPAASHAAGAAGSPGLGPSGSPGVPVVPVPSLRTPPPLAGTPRPTNPPIGETNPPTGATTEPAVRPTSTPSPAAHVATGTVDLTEADAGRAVTVAVGTRIRLVLHNVYWTVGGSDDAAVLAPVGAPVTSGAGPIACIPGSGCGTVTAVFDAVAPGRATISASRTSCGEALQCPPGAASFEVTVIVGG